MPPRPRLPITLPDYERLFRTIHAVMGNEDDDRSRVCLVFGIVGAALLRNHHGIKDARPVAGVAGYNLGTQTNHVLFYGSVESRRPVATRDAFHCWIEINGWIMDLTAPLFGAQAPVEQGGASIPPKMFQKLASSATLDDLNLPGAYLHAHDPILTNSLMLGLQGNQLLTYLIAVCDQWYSPGPKKMNLIKRMNNKYGGVDEIRLSNTRITGAW